MVVNPNGGYKSSVAAREAVDEVGAEAISLLLPALAAPRVIGFFAGRLIDLFLDRDTDKTEDGFV